MQDKYGNEYIQGKLVRANGVYDVCFSDPEALTEDVYLSERQKGEPLPWTRFGETFKGAGRPRVRCNFALQDAVDECNALATQLEDAAAQANHWKSLYVLGQDHGIMPHVWGFVFGAVLISLIMVFIAPV